LENPAFDALLRFPDGGGRPNVELSVSQNFIGLLTLPLRKKIAAADYEAAKIRVAAQVVDLAADAREAFYALQASEQLLQMRQAVLAAAAASAEAAQRLRDAGNITELQADGERALQAQAT